MEVNQVITDLGKSFEEFKTANNSRLDNIEKNKGTAELEAKLAKINEAMDKQEKMVSDLSTAMARPGAAGEGEDDSKKSLELAQKAMNDFMRKGVDSAEGIAACRKHFLEGYGLDEAKALSVDSDPNGGFLVRPEMSNQIIKDLREISPIRQLADVMTISTDAFESPYNVGGVDSGWVGEREARPETNNSLINMIRIPVHEIYAQPKATQKLLDDSFVNIEQWHQGEVLEEFAVKEGQAFISGNGITKPKGFLDYAAGTGFNQVEQVATASAAALTADAFMTIQDTLKEIYQPNAKWVMNRLTRGLVRKMKDSDGRYLFSIDALSGLNSGAPSVLLGKQIVIAEDMPAVAANSLSVAYGDFKKGYKIIDRVGIRVLRDPYTNKPFILFYTTKRVGGGVTLFPAIKILKTSV